MKKKVWLVSHYAMPPQYELRWKTLKYAEYLQMAGYEVLLVTASTIHNTNVNLIEGNEKYIEKQYEDLKFVHIKCRNYSGNGMNRILNLLEFGRRFQKVMRRFEKPDIIVCDCNCVNYRGILSFARKYKIKFVSEIRDLWPLSIIEYLGFSEKNPIMQYLFHEEKRMYRLSDGIVFSMPGGVDYIRDRKLEKAVDLDKVYYINNGIDLTEQKKQAEECVIDDEDLNGGFKIVYAGSIRQVNDVGCLLDAAARLKSGYSDIKFLIYGEGDEKAYLEQRIRDEGLTNVVMKGRVEKKYIPYICSRADVNFITVKDSALTKYGVSWNKLFDYMAAGKPIISNLKVRYDFIDEFQCGISCERQEIEDITDAIVKIHDMPREEYRMLCENAANAAKEFDYGSLTDRLIALIEKVTEKKL